MPDYDGDKGLEYYKAYPRDFFDGTLGMKGSLRGFYRMLIDLIYLQDGYLLNDWGYISGNTSYGKTQCKRMISELVSMGKIEVCGKNGEFFTQKRAKSQLKISRKFQENQRNIAAKRWENNGLADATALPKGMPNGCHHKTTRPQNTPSTASPSPPPKEEKSNPKQKKGTRLPDDWQPTTEFFEEAKKLGFSHEQAKQISERFRDYWVSASGQNAVKRDWLATWRNWLRENKSRQSRGGAVAGKQNNVRSERSSSMFSAALELLDEGRKYDDVSSR